MTRRHQIFKVDKYYDKRNIYSCRSLVPLAQLNIIIITCSKEKFLQEVRETEFRERRVFSGVMFRSHTEIIYMVITTRSQKIVRTMARPSPSLSHLPSHFQLLS